MAKIEVEESYLQGYKDLALAESLKADSEKARADEAQRLLDAATAHITSSAPPAKPKPDPAPAAPAAPPPPRPASAQEYYRLPTAERRRVAEAYGGAEKLETELDAQLHNANRIGTARVGAGSRSVQGAYGRLTTEILADASASAPKFDPNAYAGRPVARTFAGQKPVTMQEAELASKNQAIAQAQAHARAVAPAPAPTPRSNDGTFTARPAKKIYLPR